MSLLSISVLLGLAFDVLFYGKLPGVSVLIYASMVLAATWYLASGFKRRFNKSALLLMIPLVFFALMVGVRASPMLAFFNIILVLYLLLLLIAQSTNRPEMSLTSYSVGKYFINPGWLPLRFLRETFQTVRSLIADRAWLPKAAYAPYLRGIVLSLPFLILFLLLLSSADMVFQKYVGSLFDFDFSLDGQLMFRIVLILFIISLFIGAYALMFMRPPVGDARISLRKNNLGVTEANIMLGSVGALFLVFVLIQIASFFGGESYVASAGVTYAEYARRGFFQLIAVAVISMALIWAIKESVQHKNSAQVRRFKWLSGLLIAEVMIIMVSAHLRLSIYEEAYGFTILRLLSHLFIIWLALTFVSLFVYIIREEAESRFAFRLFISVIAFFALLNILNPDATIARQNINRLERTGKLDIYHLRNLSEDATPVTAQLLKHRDPTLQKSVASSLYPYMRGVENEQNDHWQSANLARYQAKRILLNNKAQIEANKRFYEIPYQFDIN